jgi:argininosuccinate lyase
MEAAASDRNLLATDLAEYLVRKGMPFREGHQLVGQLVAHCIANRVQLNKLSVAQLKKFSPVFDVDVANVFDVRRSLALRRATGAPSPENIAAQIERWRKKLL